MKDKKKQKLTKEKNETVAVFLSSSLDNLKKTKTKIIFRSLIYVFFYEDVYISNLTFD